jgi:uncharacterized protein (DUF58 family)
MSTRLIPTPRLLLVLAAGLVPLALAGQVGVILWGVAAYDAAVLLLMALDFRQAPGAATLRFARRAGPQLAVGEREQVAIRVWNDGPQAVRVAVRDEPPPAFRAEGRRTLLPVPGRGMAEAEYCVRAPGRGAYTFPGLTARVAGPLGLAERQWRVALETPVRVYPNFRLAARMELLGRRAHLIRTGLHALRRRGEGRTFESLREYVQGDEFRHIDWKATARRQRPMVREYELERHQNVFLMVDAGRMMTAQVGESTKLDYAVNAALLMAHAAIGQSDKVGLLVFADEVQAYLPPRGGTRQIRQILEALCGVHASLVEPDYGLAFRYLAARRVQRALVPLFTDLVDARASARLLRHVAALVPRHLPLLVAIADPELERYAGVRPAGVSAVYRQAVARDLLAERAEALRGITARGGLALDVPPDRLNLAVVNRYLEVKRRGMI